MGLWKEHILDPASQVGGKEGMSVPVQMGNLNMGVFSCVPYPHLPPTVLDLKREEDSEEGRSSDAGGCALSSLGRVRGLEVMSWTLERLTLSLVYLQGDDDGIDVLGTKGPRDLNDRSWLGNEAATGFLAPRKEDRG